MTIRRYVANKDTTITNAYKENLITRATDANMGESDALEVFSLYAQATTSSLEASRILVQFPIDQIVADRTAELVPGSGSVHFVMKLSNCTHPFTLPKKYSLTVSPLSRSWDEGYGLDMEGYKDIGTANWLSASSTQAWTTEGGDYYTGSEVSKYFETGVEDLEVDITDIVEQWIAGDIPNNGVIVRLSGSLESDTRSYYTKKFFARGSEYFFKRPWIEARYDATVKDDRGKFYLYNPFVPVEASYNHLYIYNRFKGTLYDLPTVGTGNIYVQLYEETALPLGTPIPLITGSGYVTSSITTATGSWVSTGIYECQIAVDTELTTVYDIWFDGSGSAIGVGGDLEVINSDSEESFTKSGFVVAIKNLKQKYETSENARLHLFIRPANWNPNSYTSLNTEPQTEIVEDMYFKVVRIADDLEVIPFGTGSHHHTRLSFDKNGNYFDLHMNLLEPGYTYGIKFTICDAGEYYENKQLFKFRVEEA